MSGLGETARPLTAPYRTTVRNEATSFRPAHSSVTGETYLELVSTLPPIGAPPGATASEEDPAPECALFSPASRRRRRRRGRARAEATGTQTMSETSSTGFDVTETFSLKGTVTSLAPMGGAEGKGEESKSRQWKEQNRQGMAAAGLSTSMRLPERQGNLNLQLSPITRPATVGRALAMSSSDAALTSLSLPRPIGYDASESIRLRKARRGK